jgi:hypothetical protein
MTGSAFLDYLIGTLTPLIVAALTLTAPPIREALAKYIAGYVQHGFTEKIELLKSDLRQREEVVRAELRANEQQIKSLTDTALSLRTTRQAALEARRLQAIEKLWAAKLSIDRWKMAAVLVSKLNLEEVYKAVESGDKRVREFAARLDKLGGVDFNPDKPLDSALSEQPFLPIGIWTLFSAYNGVISHSALILKALAEDTTKFLKKEDTLKELMLQALPEYSSYINEHGFTGYYYLLEVIQQKLLNEIAEMLDGKNTDTVNLRHSAEIVARARHLSTGVNAAIPDGLEAPDIPPPTAIP